MKYRNIQKLLAILPVLCVLLCWMPVRALALTTVLSANVPDEVCLRVGITGKGTVTVGEKKLSSTGTAAVKRHQPFTVTYWFDRGYEAKWHEYTGREYDEHANRVKDGATNVYGAEGDHQEMNLQSVCYSSGNYIAQSSFSYTYLYLPNEEADLDLIWKNVRIICGEEVWGIG